MGICLDLSNYDADVAEPESAAALARAGVTQAIVGCQDPEIARSQIAALRAVDIRVIGVYAFLYFGLDSAGQTQAAIDVAREFGIARVWLDVESVAPNEKPGLTPGERCEELHQCVALVEDAGLECGIYTGRWYWVPRMANSTEFSRLPLWHSEYPADRHAIATVDYGGWTNVAIHQYASDIPLCGRNRDHNYVFEEERSMASRLEDLIAVVVGNGLEATCYPGTDDLFPAGTTVVPEGESGPTTLLTGETALAYAVRRGYSLALGLAIARRELGRHMSDGHG
jgi:hypothetical protein